MTIEMRAPCGQCGAINGTSEERGGQDIVRCFPLGHYCYCRPKAESGKAPRSVRDRPAIKPSTRYRIIERDGHRCLSCGRAAHEVVLHVDHFLPLSHPLADGMSESDLWADANLVTLCEECNLGKSDALPSLPSVFVALLRYYRSAA